MPKRSPDTAVGLFLSCQALALTQIITRTLLKIGFAQPKHSDSYHTLQSSTGLFRLLLSVFAGAGKPWLLKSVGSGYAIGSTGTYGISAAALVLLSTFITWGLARWCNDPPIRPASTFRHIFATLLKANGEDVKTVQVLLRHTNTTVTMNVYAQGVTELKRKAHHRIVRMVIVGKSEEEEENR